MLTLLSETHYLSIYLINFCVKKTKKNSEIIYSVNSLKLCIKHIEHKYWPSIFLLSIHLYTERPPYSGGSLFDFMTCERLLRLWHSLLRPWRHSPGCQEGPTAVTYSQSAIISSLFGSALPSNARHLWARSLRNTACLRLAPLHDKRPLFTG